MCGLVTVLGTIGVDERKIFRELLKVDSLRGEHSTGILADYDVVKRAMNALDFLQFRPATDAIMQADEILMGHNRYATQGSINNINAHPFEIGNIVGAHNGTLTNKRELPDAEDFEVDSENLYHSIDKIGLEATVKIMKGAYALTWYDYKTETFNVLRNDERTLFYTFSNDNKTMFIASEREMLQLVLNRNFYSYKEIHSFGVHKHYKFVIPERQKQIELPVITDLDHLVPPQWTGHVQLMGKPQTKEDEVVEFYMLGLKENEYGKEYLEAVSCSSECEELRIFVEKWPHLKLHADSDHIFSGKVSYRHRGYVTITPDSVEVLHEGEPEKAYIKGFGGELLTEREFDQRTAGGCDWCTFDVTHNDAVQWTGPNSFVCSSCKHNETVLDHLQQAYLGYDY